jgi:hypothetical protein
MGQKHRTSPCSTVVMPWSDYNYTNIDETLNRQRQQQYQQHYQQQTISRRGSGVAPNHQ